MNIANRLLVQPEYEYQKLEDGQLRVTRTSLFSKKRNTMDLPITEFALHDYTAGRGLIQDIFPDLTADQREFIQSGATPEEWESIFG